jgi:hypothetical protein
MVGVTLAVGLMPLLLLLPQAKAPAKPCTALPQLPPYTLRCQSRRWNATPLLLLLLPPHAKGSCQVLHGTSTAATLHQT